MSPSDVTAPRRGRSVATPGQHVLSLRVRYSETDQMGTVYNSRPLEWFECGRTELLRHLGLPYATLEERGLFLPVIEAHVEYQGRARYDDLLEMRTGLTMVGRARIRCDNTVVQATTRRPVACGYTVHAFTDRAGRLLRPPAWFLQAIACCETNSVPPNPNSAPVDPSCP